MYGYGATPWSLGATEPALPAPSTFDRITETVKANITPGLVGAAIGGLAVFLLKSKKCKR